MLCQKLKISKRKAFVIPKSLIKEGTWNLLFPIKLDLALLFTGAWIPKVLSESEYLQIDLLQVRNITAILTQGRDEAGCGCSEWVTKYKLSYSLCGGVWSYYKANGTVKVSSVYQSI